MARTAIPPISEPLRSDILRRIVADFGGKEHPPYLQHIACPACGKREAFASLDAPWVILCGRQNKCGQTHHVKELFPDLFEDWTTRFRIAPRRDAAPNSSGAADQAGYLEPQDGAPAGSATPVADAYLSLGRGFDLNLIAGWYAEETYHDPEANATTTTVRFRIPGGYWERLIDRPARFGKMKARVQPGARYAGQWWSPPGADLAYADEIWIVEGIFDAISLLHASLSACASIGVSNYPGDALAALAFQCDQASLPRPMLVWAYDGDAAGSRYTRSHAARAEQDGWKVKAARIPQGRVKRDWNDAHQRGELTADHLKEYRYQGALHLADSARAKGTLIYQRTERKEFWFEFHRRIYWCAFSQERFDRALTERGIVEDSAPLPTERAECLTAALSMPELSNCHPEALYYLANPITDEAWYYWQVHFPHDGPPAKSTFTGAQLSSASEFKKRLLHVAPGAIWEGTSSQLDRLLRDQISGIKTVQTIDYIGYTREHGCYVFGDLCVKDGRTYTFNNEDYFDIGKRSLKTLSNSPTLVINPEPKQYQTAWAGLIWQAYGARGVVALAYWLGSLYAEQIRDLHKSYPFLEIVGEASSGKSTLIEFLWKLCGRRDYEGFDPLKSTQAGRSRNMTQVSNLPVVLIESDREIENGKGQRQFDWDELKPLYNGRPTRSRGYRNQGNDTYEPPFRGALVIAQNEAVKASPAILQRIVHIELNRDTHTAESKRMAEILERTPIEQVSGFILQAVMAEKKILKLFAEKMSTYENCLSQLPGIRVLRLAKNHAQIAALVECLGGQGLGILPVNAIGEALLEVERMAVERQTTINEEHPIVSEFWEAFDYLEWQKRDATRVNHLPPDSGMIGVNLKHIESIAGLEHIRLPDTPALKRHLRSSKGRTFIEANRAVRSQIYQEGRTTRCWIFAAGTGNLD